MTDQVQNQYQKYIGNWVRITTISGGAPQGLVEEANYNFISLKPSLIGENIEQEEDSKPELRLERRIPTTITTDKIITIQPIREDYIKELLKRYPIKWDNDQLKLF